MLTRRVPSVCAAVIGCASAAGRATGTRGPRPLCTRTADSEQQFTITRDYVDSARTAMDNETSLVHTAHFLLVLTV